MAVDVLQTLINKTDNVEVIRDQIGAILLAEVNNQMALATAASLDPDDWKLRIFTEASNPWEQFLETPVTDKSPIVNIWFDSETFNQSSSNIMQRQKAEAIYNIDCYGYGESEEETVGGGHTPGDKTAALESARAIRLVRNILMAAQNTYLQLRGLVWGRWPMSINAFQPERGVDGAQKIVASRLSFGVAFNEFSPQYVPVKLNYVAIDVYRADDGQLYFEHDFDYTRIDADAATLYIAGAATLPRAKLLNAAAPSLHLSGAADLVIGDAILVDPASLVLAGAATLPRAKLINADAVGLQLVGAATIPRAKLLSAESASLHLSGAAEIVSESVIQADAGSLHIAGAATLPRAKILNAEAGSLQLAGSAGIGRQVDATAASLHLAGAATLPRDLLLTAKSQALHISGGATLVSDNQIEADAGSLHLAGSATLPRAKVLNAEAGGLHVAGAATLPRSKLLNANAGSLHLAGSATLPRAKVLNAEAASLQIQGAATLPRALLLTAVAQVMHVSGAADIVSEDQIDAAAGSLHIAGAATLPRAKVINAAAGSLHIAGAATLESPVTVWFVDPTGSGVEDGTSWDDAFGDIPSAVTAASAGEEIWIKEGTYTISSAITIKANVDTYGGFASTLTGTAGSVAGRDLVNDITTVDSNNSSRIFTCVSSMLVDGIRAYRGTIAATGGGCSYIDTLTGVTFSNCTFDTNTSTATTNGGAFLIESSTVTFADCTFTANDANRGGAIYADDTTLTITDSAFTSNACDDRAAGLFILGDGTLTLSDTDFTSNVSDDDYGAFWIQCQSTINDCRFITNTATGNTGGAGRTATTTGNTITFNDCEFDSNVGNNGGAVYVEWPAIFNRCSFHGHDGSSMNVCFTSSGDAGVATQYNDCRFYENDANKIFYLNTTGQDTTIQNCVIHDNDLSGFEPMVIWNRRETCNVINTTIAGNSLSSFFLIEVDAGSVEMVNSIVHENTLVGDPFSGTVNATYSDIDVTPVYTGTGNINGDPLFIDTGNDPWSIGAGSPCIDAGDGDEASTLDILGNARYDDPATTNTGTGTPPYTDIGAYEYQGL
jgi:predicted outer membrane repeat protein